MPGTYRSPIETGFYYIHHRYYDPQLCRWINADEPQNLGANGEFISHNLFAYCLNNSVNGYDPDGSINWEGVIAGVALVAVAVATVATFGTALPVLATVAVAAVATTGAVTTYAAATESTMVLDASATIATDPCTYNKVGFSIIMDYSSGGIYGYLHVGKGKSFPGSSPVSASYSVGIVNNFNDPDDYSGHFIDASGSINGLGFGHCWSPGYKPLTATNATTLTFSSGTNLNVGYDWYYSPIVFKEGFVEK